MPLTATSSTGVCLRLLANGRGSGRRFSRRICCCESDFFVEIVDLLFRHLSFRQTSTSHFLRSVFLDHLVGHFSLIRISCVGVVLHHSLWFVHFCPFSTSTSDVLFESFFAFGCLANVDVSVLTFEDVDVYHVQNEPQRSYETTEVCFVVFQSSNAVRTRLISPK